MISRQRPYRHRVSNISRFVRGFHYVAALLVCTQLLVWLVSGLYFNLIAPQHLSGTTYLAPTIHQPLLAHKSHAKTSDESYGAPQALIEPQLLAAHSEQIAQIKLVTLAQRTVYLLDEVSTRYPHQCQQQKLIDAYSGKEVMLDKEWVQQLALSTYQGRAEVVSITRLAAPIVQWPKYCDALWQVKLSDELNTRIYIHSQNGQLVGHKNDNTDIADLMFKLHFMDYLNQGSFNNPFSWLLAVLLFLLCLSGCYWVVNNVIHQRYKLR